MWACVDWKSLRVRGLTADKMWRAADRSTAFPFPSVWDWFWSFNLPEDTLKFSCVFEMPPFDLFIQAKKWLFPPNSWQAYFYNDDTFNFNYAQAKAALGNYEEAEEVRHLFWTTGFLKKQIHWVSEAVRVLTTAISFSSIFCWFRMKSSRTTTFISAGWHDAVRIKIFPPD